MKINDEIIERLVIDRTCDELNDDAAALLNAWLNANPADNKIAEKITATFQLTESTVQQKVDSFHNSKTASSKSMPKLSKLSLLLPRITQAAVVLLALTLGLWIGSLSSSINRANPPAPEPTIIYPINIDQDSKNSLLKKEGLWHNFLIASAQPSSFPPRQKLLQNDNNFWPDINQIKERQKND